MPKGKGNYRSFLLPFATTSDIYHVVIRQKRSDISISYFASLDSAMANMTLSSCCCHAQGAKACTRALVSTGDAYLPLLVTFPCCHQAKKVWHQHSHSYYGSLNGATANMTLSFCCCHAQGAKACTRALVPTGDAYLPLLVTFPCCHQAKKV
jgi:hypothetical protein